jgi:hypothetical protein
MNDSWGWRRKDTNCKSPRDLASWLSGVVPRGGTLLMPMTTTGRDPMCWPS